MLEILSNEEIMQDYVLSKIIRYNHRRKLQDESVAEHTCFVSLFCLKIMAKLDISIEDRYNVLVCAALHDAAESFTSDIPHDVKRQNKDMEEILKRIEGKYYEENWKEYCSVINNQSPKVIAIIKLADTYSVYQYCLNEIDLGNMSDEIKDIIKHARQMIEFYTEALN